MCSRPSPRRRCSTIFRISAIKVFKRGTSARSAVQNVGDRFASYGFRRIDRALVQPAELIRRILLRALGHRVRINLLSQQELSMANDRQSRQQSSERAQTSGAQQGEWQPNQRTPIGSQGSYPQESQFSTRGNLAKRRESGLEGGDPGFRPFSVM